MHINLDINSQYRYLLNVSHLGVSENSRCKFDNSLNLVLSTGLSSVPKFTRRLIRWLLLPINAIHLRSIFDIYPVSNSFEFHSLDSFEGMLRNQICTKFNR
jgi:hypothetical protein